jgi:hypothetical protein
VLSVGWAELRGGDDVAQLRPLLFTKECDGEKNFRGNGDVGIAVLSAHYDKTAFRLLMISRGEKRYAIAESDPELILRGTAQRNEIEIGQRSPVLFEGRHRRTLGEQVFPP